MTTFRFRLEKVLAWRHTQLELEEAKYQQQTRVVAELDRQNAQWDAVKQGAEVQVRGWVPLLGGDLASLEDFRSHVRAQKKQLTLRITEERRRLEAQQRAVLEARRQCELLERLKQRRLEEWQAAANKEIEELGAESYLSSISRQRS
ncbi:MAG: hypothetical protein JO323_16915 [Acidobacteriia bacterium]|nr:hypothetical protein [Terriglobia bacterium]